MPPRPFDGQVWWVTGASSGIGRAVVAGAVAGGARVLATARRREALIEACRAAGAAAPGGSGGDGRPAGAEPLPGDLEDLDGLAALAAAAEARHGRIDVLVNAAGIGQRGTAAETAFAVDRRLLAVNTLAPIGLVKAVLPGMLARGSGRLLAVSSIAGLVGPPRRSAYAASKHALHGFFESLEGELPGSGVSTTLVCPGYVATGFAEAALAADGRAAGPAAARKTGVPPERVARRLLRAVEYRERLVVIGGKEVFAWYLKRLAPGLLARLLPRLSPP
jgi:short-subunit dehydrogenase